MKRIVKLLGLAASTACILLLGATPALAQTGDSITCSVSPYSGSGPLPDGGGGQGPNLRASGNWTTASGDTVGNITIMWSQDQIGWVSIHVPAANITGQGQTSGTFSMPFYLPPGKYYIFGAMSTQKGGLATSQTITYTIP